MAQVTNDDLAKVYSKFGREGLIALLSKQPSKYQSSRPQVSKAALIVTAIVQHLERAIYTCIKELFERSEAYDLQSREARIQNNTPSFRRIYWRGGSRGYRS